ncbi:hypothetical protein FEP71_04576 [Burkholderia multivorans]|nr:hypothetical protein [Burkholderia multivorans]MDR9004748.1 hypothetical protein [Burkholderia multivorans]MDR9047014.1 hypothetical protein [Burkholderia multivorans]
MDVVLIRHPAVAVASGVCYGRTDVPLAGSADAAARLLHDRLSNRLPSQALWSESSQGVLDLTMALSMVRSLRMQATNATLGSLPAAFRR